jgi:predicted  nucleic acid-binding Zn-ribbon protein
MSLVLNNIVIESRKSDNFVNATQLCKAGGKKFSHWINLDSTKELIKELEKSLHAGIPACKKLIDVSKSKHKGSWIHPDLAVQLAQWISPSFAIQVSRWIRELFITGSVSIDSKKSDEDLRELQDQLFQKNKQLQEKDQAIAKLERQKLALNSFVENQRLLEKDQIFYLATTKAYATQNRFEYGGVKQKKDLRSRLSTYNTGRAENDLMYYVKIIECNNYKEIESRIANILQRFKDKLNGKKEMLHMRFNVLEEMTDFLVENYDKEVEFINKHCNKFFEETIHCDPILPEPIQLENMMQISVRCNGTTKTKEIDVSDWTDEKIDNTFTHIVDTCLQNKYPNPNQNQDKKKELNWSDLTSHMKIHKGIKMGIWRDWFKTWIIEHFADNVRPTIKGIKY